MSIDVDIRNMRRNYTLFTLEEQKLSDNPMEMFAVWLEDAIKSEVEEPNAMAFSTVFENRPKTRIVLLKQIVDENFIFFTNYNSNKGKEIEINPYVSLTFFWDKMQRQVRVEGVAKKTSAKISDEYFSMRARDSQIAAWVSNQSEVMTKEQLKNNLEFYNNKFKNLPVPRPNHWGAIEVEAYSIEFWQGGANRLHDRILYEKINNSWKKKRLGP